MKRRLLNSWVLGSLFIGLFLISVPNDAEARFQSQSQLNSSLPNQQAKPIKPVIKVEEFEYKENKLTSNSLYDPIIEKLFGESDNRQSEAISNRATSRNGRILLPQMVGGLETLFSQIEYPAQAKAKGIEGVVKVEFTVNELGMVRDVSIIHGIGSGCDEEVIRALKNSRFSPAVRNGRFVKVKLTQSILFELKQLKR